MKRINISSGSKYEDIIGFSRAVKIANTIAVAGTAPINDDCSTVGTNDPFTQTKRCFEISKKAIEDVGGKLENVIRTRIMLTNIKDWEQAAKAHGEFFNNIKPACTFVEVSRFINSEWLVETEVDCIIE
ncbi:MAG: RidA family protein [Ignavibacteria bacterium]